jgi:bacterioferritin (cytochrome b1)
MDASAFIDRVKSECATELERLGSEKALVATTMAELENDRVLETAAQAELRAEATFDAWSTDENHDAARDTFEQCAAQEREHADRIIDRLEGDRDLDPRADDLHQYLRALETTPERVGAGMVGRPLASSRTLLQTINFFVNEADEVTADLFRDIRTETETLVEEGTTLLETVCETDGERDNAETAAVEAIQTAYGEYVETLEGMGLDPRPVC